MGNSFGFIMIFGYCHIWFLTYKVLSKIFLLYYLKQNRHSPRVSYNCSIFVVTYIFQWTMTGDSHEEPNSSVTPVILNCFLMIQFQTYELYLYIWKKLKIWNFHNDMFVKNAINIYPVGDFLQDICWCWSFTTL